MCMELCIEEIKHLSAECGIANKGGKKTLAEVNLFGTEGKPFPGSYKLAAVEFQK